MESKKKKYLFTYLKTGGGHIAPARSVSNYIQKYNNAGTEVLLVDGFEKTKRFAKFIVEDGYRILQSKTKWIFEAIYAVHKIEFISRISAYLVSLNTIKYLTETIRNEKPDKIVIFHFFLIKPVYKILKKYKLNIPVVTIVTDPYTAHPIWFLKKDQKFIVFSQQLKNHCVKKGTASNCIKVFPFILDEKYSQLVSAGKVTEHKKKLDLTKDKVLLIMGGGDGIPNGIKILKNILNNPADYEIAFVCGRNKKMFDEALRLKQKFNYDRLKIYGFIDFVYELLCVSDVVITKCGASTFMEILMSKKIPVVNSYIWEQEKGNVDFLVNNNLGIYEKRIRKLPQIINKLFFDENVLKLYKDNIENAHLENGVSKVAEFILS